MGVWKQIAQRWSGRGRLRTFVVISALLLADWNPYLQAAGLVVYALGLLLHGIAKGHLVRNVELCAVGPYGWVRHPFYVANFLTDLGLCLLSGSAWLAAGYLILFPLAYFPRVLAEEEVLAERFGNAFSAYCARVPRWFPNRLPQLGAWLREVSLENLVRENEISRLLRLGSYPLLLAAYVILRHDGYAKQEMWVVPLALAAGAFGLWAVGEIVHRIVEDGAPAFLDTVLWRLKYAWLVLPLLPFLDDRIPFHDALEMEHHDLALWVFGGFCTLGGLLSSWLFRARRNQYPFGLGLALCAFGVSVASEFVVLAPIFAMAAWTGWFASKSRTDTQLERRSGLALPVCCTCLFVLALAIFEGLLEVH